MRLIVFQVCAMVVLAQLSPEHGWQVKWALNFPNAPNGASEAIIAHAIKVMASEGERHMTFGTSAREVIEPANNVGGLRFKGMAKTYKSITSAFNLTNKTDFRRKFGVEEEPVFVAYPPHGLGISGCVNFSLVSKRGRGC